MLLAESVFRQFPVDDYNCGGHCRRVSSLGAHLRMHLRKVPCIGPLLSRFGLEDSDLVFSAWVAQVVRFAIPPCSPGGCFSGPSVYGVLFGARGPGVRLAPPCSVLT